MECRLTVGVGFLMMGCHIAGRRTISQGSAQGRDTWRLTFITLITDVDPFVPGREVQVECQLVLDSRRESYRFH